MKVAMYVGAGMLGLCVATGAVADESAGKPQTPIRSFDRFELDTGTANGFRGEFVTFYDNKSGLRSLDTPTFEERAGRDLDMLTTEMRLAAGGEKLEVGVIFPYHFVDDIHGSTPDQNDVGDIRTYIKIVPIRSKWVDVGCGYDLLIDSGDQADDFGYNEIGHLPFASATGHFGPVHVNGHVGYRFLNHPSNAEAGESLVYGAGIYWPFLDRFVARTEFVAQQFDAPGDNYGMFAIEPGLDVLLPFDMIDVVLRPSGSVGLNGHTSDWGVGGSIVLRSPLPKGDI